MDNEIDYKAIADGLMRDLESARIDKMKLQHELNSIPSRFALSLEDIKSFIQRNYVVLMFAILVTHTLFSMVIEYVSAFKMRRQP
jgi:hypothetical protein